MHRRLNIKRGTIDIEFSNGSILYYDQIGRYPELFTQMPSIVKGLKSNNVHSATMNMSRTYEHAKNPSLNKTVEINEIKFTYEEALDLYDYLREYYEEKANNL